ncbi:MAG: transposase, partial [Prevotellaceae bacterium]|nr:transposase [Prevotellaceae bacterium]
HIDLVSRRLLKGEKIPEGEKLFSIFEPYTEWIAKGKQRPQVELGKKVNITTDQHQLIVSYQTVDHQSDSQLVLALADRLTPLFEIGSWSFDKGYWHPDNRALLALVIPEVILPKKGKCSQEEAQREADKSFKKLRRQHSAVESNIHSLETRGLSRCPDRGIAHFRRYVGWAVCAYNLCCIGRKLQAGYRREAHLLQRAA